MLMIGTQGWLHPAWVSSFYPPGITSSEMLRCYAKVFPTVEVDSSFYTIPPNPVLVEWKQAVPPGFVFSFKVPQSVTHERRLEGAGATITKLVRRVELLEEHAGPLLLKLSPDFKATAENRVTLSAFLKSLPRDFKWAVEFRHADWLVEETLATLRRQNVALALVEDRWIKLETMLVAAQVPTGSFAYARFTAAARTSWRHGEGESTSGEGAAADWCTTLAGLARWVDTIFGYFSDRYDGHAPRSAREFQRKFDRMPAEPHALRQASC